MPLYMIKFKGFATAVDRSNFMSEIEEEHGGRFVRRCVVQGGYIYDVPEDSLDKKELKTKDIIEFSERQAQQSP